jgi:hypothetical protein|tara:strand:- start:331 stop:690 length:360 start_codon:yes stop_codon:yes gene_type:complete
MSQAPIKDETLETFGNNFEVEFWSPVGKHYGVSSFESEVRFELDRFLGMGCSHGRATTVYGPEAVETLKEKYETIYHDVTWEFHSEDTYKSFILHGIGAYVGSVYVEFCIARVIEKMME